MRRTTCPSSANWPKSRSSRISPLLSNRSVCGTGGSDRGSLKTDAAENPWTASWMAVCPPIHKPDICFPRASHYRILQARVGFRVNQLTTTIIAVGSFPEWNDLYGLFTSYIRWNDRLTPTLPEVFIARCSPCATPVPRRSAAAPDPGAVPVPQLQKAVLRQAAAPPE